MIRHHFFKVLAVTVNSFQNQGRNVSSNARSATLSNKYVRHISVSISGDHLKSRRSRGSDAVRTAFKKKSAPLDLISVMESFWNRNPPAIITKSSSSLDMEVHALNHSDGDFPSITAICGSNEDHGQSFYK
ncbi:hypothetical protein F2Q69_00052219 [Brassica cretica]|uniref:Uncharacterized protein n=1 Tax=Brassica cretica TaxID=69181 RepID=A0A8S9MUX4_BRACR|nr:hypothetical protein F2Q69_00052219 [Brassica cretica]